MIVCLGVSRECDIQCNEYEQPRIDKREQKENKCRVNVEQWFLGMGIAKNSQRASRVPSRGATG